MTDLGRRVGIKIRRWLHRAEQWRHIGRHRIRVMKKLDESKVNWIIKKKREGSMTAIQIVESMNVLQSGSKNCGPDIGTAQVPLPIRSGWAGLITVCLAGGNILSYCLHGAGIEEGQYVQRRT